VSAECHTTGGGDTAAGACLCLRAAEPAEDKSIMILIRICTPSAQSVSARKLKVVIAQHFLCGSKTRDTA